MRIKVKLINIYQQNFLKIVKFKKNLKINNLNLIKKFLNK